MNFPFLQKRDRGDCAGRVEIVFSHDQSYDEAEAFAARVVEQLGLTVDRRIRGPYSWLWDVHGAGGHFVFGYDDFPCETTLWATDAESDLALLHLFGALDSRASSST